MGRTGLRDSAEGGNRTTLGKLLERLLRKEGEAWCQTLTETLPTLRTSLWKQVEVPQMDFQGRGVIWHKLVAETFHGKDRADWRWIKMEEVSAAPGALDGWCPAEVRLLFRTQSPAVPDQVRDFALVNLPDPYNAGRQRRPCGTVRLKARKKENLMIVPIESIKGRAQVIPYTRDADGKVSIWMINHRVDLATFNHIGGMMEMDDDL